MDLYVEFGVFQKLLGVKSAAEKPCNQETKSDAILLRWKRNKRNQTNA